MDDEITMRPMRHHFLIVTLVAFLTFGVSAQAQNPTEDTSLKQVTPKPNKQGESATPPKGNPSALNPETLRLMEMIEKKNRELKKREAELLLREKKS